MRFRVTGYKKFLIPWSVVSLYINAYWPRTVGVFGDNSAAEFHRISQIAPQNLAKFVAENGGFGHNQWC